MNQPADENNAVHHAVTAEGSHPTQPAQAGGTAAPAVGTGSQGASREPLPTSPVDATPPASSQSRRLPRAQPARAIVVLAYYLVVVVAGAGLVFLRFEPALAAIFTVAWALVLLVPVAVALPRPRDGDPPSPGEWVPVLHRRAR